MTSLTLVLFRPATTWIESSSGFTSTTGNVSPLKPMITSTKSPVLMIVPTPETASIWSDMARWPSGTVITGRSALPVLKSAVVSCWPAVTGTRTIWPTTWLGVRDRRPAGARSTGSVSIVSMSSVTRAPSAMSWAAMTVGCGGGDADVARPLCCCLHRPA